MDFYILILEYERVSIWDKIELLSMNNIFELHNFSSVDKVLFPVWEIPHSYSHNVQERA